jgi:hypothetical protein
MMKKTKQKNLGKKVADSFVAWFNKGVVDTKKLKRR